jgi:hypothetical protein
MAYSDGVSDATQVLQEFIDRGGNLSDLPPGRYLIQGTVKSPRSYTLAPGSTIRGRGRDGTVIEVPE